MFAALRHILLSIALLWSFSSSTAGADNPDRPDAVLSAFHQAASDGDWKTYFNLLTDDAIFLGTDISEHWDKPTFERYAKATKGWTYVQKETHFYHSPDGNTAWFDETLWNEKYGHSRGTGVLIRVQKGWKIAQYHLTFPIPNALAGEFTARIQEVEKNQTKD